MTDEKLARYLVRTLKHVHRVQRNMVYLIVRHSARLELTREEIREAMYNVMNHDRSKFSPEQFEAYIELTEFYRQRKTLKNESYEYPPGVGEAVDRAVTAHYHNENHHPERMAGAMGKWGKLEALETVCDLQAMAQEFGEGNCRQYFEKVWRPKHAKNFYDDFNWFEVTTYMDAAIKCFEGRISD